jgi:hypothetical protein
MSFVPNYKSVKSYKLGFCNLPARIGLDRSTVDLNLVRSISVNFSSNPSSKMFSTYSPLVNKVIF